MGKTKQLAMADDVQIAEILEEAHSYNLRREVHELAKTMPHPNSVETYQIALKMLIK